MCSQEGKMSHHKIGSDPRKPLSLYAVLHPVAQAIGCTRVNHERGTIRGFLPGFPRICR